MLMRSTSATVGDAATTLGTCSRTARTSSMVMGSGVESMRFEPPWYSAEIMLVPIDCNWRRMYCLPVRPMVATRMTEAVPTAMAKAVRVNCNLLLQKESKTKFRISLRPIVMRRGALTVDAVVGVTQGGVAVAILSS